ncbi:MAG: DUF4157 domain-containing protein [Lachnospiraceae bacterium]|nr:DUF4157 domain-containing protein [Lachnospiraceae bacterium]
MQQRQTKKTQSPNVTEIPQGMKTQFENASGLSFDDVRVHYCSEKPAQFNALAYTQGNHVYLAKGQEKHLGHELGHVVQQKRGLVRANRLINGQPVNDEPRLEAAADHIQKLSAQTEPVSFLGGGIIQRITEEEALSLARGIDISEEDYNDVLKPAICVEAERKGKSFANFIRDLSEENFTTKLRILRTPFDPDIDTDGIFELKYGEVAYCCMPSKRYPNFCFINGLPLLVHHQVIAETRNYKELFSFIRQYAGGGIKHYRGMNIAHFAWEVLRKHGILASDSSDDNPTFTMDTPTRWLPFDNDINIARCVAASPGGENTGLAEIIWDDEKGIEIPIGAIIPFMADVGVPVAYLNGGEKVIRGPLKIHEAVDVVTSKKRTFHAVPVHELPVAAPYKATKEQLRDWVEYVQGWMQEHAGRALEEEPQPEISG